MANSKAKSWYSCIGQIHLKYEDACVCEEMINSQLSTYHCIRSGSKACINEIAYM